MKLQFKHQPFQAEAADAVCDVFCGQPYRTVTYRRDLGDLTGVQISTYDTEVGFRNQPLVPDLTNRRLLDNLRAVQRRNGLKPSDELTGPGVNLSIEMETGTGKTYTYVKTMYELNKRYGWSKFIIVVPSVAIREGVYKSLQTTQEHFAGEYNKKIRFFIYNSDRLTEVDRFASDSAINVMIINMQAFNSSKNQRIIEIKEIRMSPGIGENDFNTKLKNGQKFLLDGDRLKVTVRFRGREMAHTNIGEQLLTNFAAQCAEIATMDKNPKMEGRNMFMFLSPKAPDKQANKK